MANENCAGVWHIYSINHGPSLMIPLILDVHTMHNSSKVVISVFLQLSFPLLCSWTFAFTVCWTISKRLIHTLTGVQHYYYSITIISSTYLTGSQLYIVFYFTSIMHEWIGQGLLGSTVCVSAGPLLVDLIDLIWFLI